MFPTVHFINEINRILDSVDQLSGSTGYCTERDIIKDCALIAFGGRSHDHKTNLRLCDNAGLIERKKSRITLTDLGQRYLELNPSSFYEATEKQKTFLFKEVLIKKTWKSEIRDLFLNFIPNFEDVTYELDITVDGFPITRYGVILQTLMNLGVLIKTKGRYIVSSDYVASVISILSDKKPVTEESLEAALTRKRKLGAIAEDWVVNYEKKRLRSMGRIAEADNVHKVSQLDVTAGYDIKSFDGDKPKLMHDRFIEVKCSVENRVKFYWSSNEIEKSKILKGKYWVYFLPNFCHDDNKTKPIMIQDPYEKVFEEGEYDFQAISYLVTSISKNDD